MAVVDQDVRWPPKNLCLRRKGAGQAPRNENGGPRVKAIVVSRAVTGSKKQVGQALPPANRGLDQALAGAFAQCRLLCSAKRSLAQPEQARAFFHWTFSPPLGIVCWMAPFTHQA